MPYSSTAELPDYVKKLSPKKRRQWMHTFNSVFKSTNNEGRAFRAANSAVKEFDSGILAKSIKEFRDGNPHQGDIS